MKFKTYRVYFTTNRLCIVTAFSKEQARILAQAEEIKNGNDYTVVSVTEV